MVFRLSVMPGFSTLPGNLYDPLIRHLYGLQVILAFLIIFGGIGFPILFNYGRLLHYGIRNKIKCLLGMNYKVIHEPRIVSTTTRIVLPTTLILLVVGTALFWIFENHNVLDGMSFTGKFATSFMGAVTPRTAGFNNVDMSMLPRSDNLPHDCLDVDRCGSDVHGGWYQGDNLRDCFKKYMGESRGERSGCYRTSSIDSGEREPGAFDHHTLHPVDHPGSFCHRDSGTEGNTDSSSF